MCRTRAAWFAVSVLAVASFGCGEPTATVRPWASNAERWSHALFDAGNQGTDNAMGFYASDAVLDDRPAQRILRGRSDIAEFAADVLGETTAFDEMGLFVSADEAIVQFAWQLEPRIDFADRVVVEPDGITLRVVTPSVEGGRRYAPHAWDFAATEELARRWVAMWNGTEDATGLYAAAATIDDTLLGNSIVGATAIEEARGSGRWPDLDALHIVHLPGGRGQAVYVSAAERAIGPDEVRIVVREEIAGCSALAAITLAVEDGHVVWERRYHEVTSTRACLDPTALQPGWWEDVVVPSPVAHRQTAVVVAGASRIEVFNGTPGLDSYLRWAIGRFTVAGLDPPHVSEVTFLADADRCDGYDGWSSPTPDGETITLCLHADEICEDFTACSTWTLNSRLTILHELAHGWLAEHLDDATRDAFDEFVGVARWNDPGDPWAIRGVERAASTLGSGLIDDFGASGCVDSSYCNVRDGAFEVLTGRRPLTVVVRPG